MPSSTPQREPGAPGFLDPRQPFSVLPSKSSFQPAFVSSAVNWDAAGVAAFWACVVETNAAPSRPKARRAAVRVVSVNICGVLSDREVQLLPHVVAVHSRTIL